jgi:hypothetical protein
MTAANQADPAELLTRVEWLRAHGFGRNPFSFNSFDGKTDLMLDDAFLTFARTPEEWDDLIRGSLDDPGRRFILACSGGGKTALRQQLKREFESDMYSATPGVGKILVVEYVEHDYNDYQCNALSHVRRIKHLAESVLCKPQLGSSSEASRIRSREDENYVEARAQLRRNLTHYFTTEELNTLCFDLGIDYEDVRGSDKPSKARELVAHFESRRRIPDLIRACRSVRPNVAWNQIFSVLGNILDQRGVNPTEDTDIDQSPLALLEKMVADCRARGFSGVCVLVDNIDFSQDAGTAFIFHRTLPLICYPDLLSADGVIFKFLLPSELNREDRRRLPTAKYPLYPIIWDREKLERVLQKRLAECLDSSVRGPQSSPDSQGLMHLRELCADEWSGVVDSVFIEFGLWAGQPRAMWQLGHYLMMEHFCQAKRSAADLIKLRSLWEAIERLQSEVQLQLDSGPYDVRERIMGLLKK